MLVRNFRQRFLVEIDGMNRAAGSQQLRKRGCERSVAAAKIAPELRSPPLNVGCMNQRRGVTDLHLYTVFLTDEKPASRYERAGRGIANPKRTIANQLLGLQDTWSLRRELGRDREACTCVIQNDVEVVHN